MTLQRGIVYRKDLLVEVGEKGLSSQRGGSKTDVVIVGAGPYGLSLAAHLGDRGVEYKIFGKPMQFWKDHAPPDMLLKSTGAASDLFAPASKCSVADYCAERQLPYSELKPISSDLFIDYGRAFQERFVPDVDRRNVASVARSADGFVIRLEDGESIRAKRVVMAVGIRAFTHVPGPIAALPGEFVSHSVDYGAVDALLGRRVVVVGSGASAIDLAAALHERQVDVTVVSRRSSVRFQSEPPPRKVYDWILYPDSPIGGSWDLWFYANAPQLFHLLPEKTKLRIVATTLGPFPGWFMTERVRGRIPISSGQQVERAEIVAGRVRMTTTSRDGKRNEFTADHVVAATGYKVDIDRLDILDRGLKDEVVRAEGSPVLSSRFESSAKGLYFVGVAAAASFGPVMRFVAGAGLPSAGFQRR